MNVFISAIKILDTIIEYRAQTDLKLVEMFHNNNSISIIVDNLKSLRFTETLIVIKLLQSLLQVFTSFLVVNILFNHYFHHKISNYYLL